MKTRNQNGKNSMHIIGIIVGAIIGFAAVTILCDALGIGNSYFDYNYEQVTNSRSDIEKSVPFGDYIDNTYTNTAAGLSFTLPDDDWSFKNSDEIMAILEDNKPQKNENGRVYVENEAELCYYDMIAFNNINSASIQFALTMGKSDSYAASTTADLYLNNLKKSLSQFSDDTSDYYDVKIAGESYRVMDCTYSDLGCIQTIAVRKTDSGYINVLLTRYNDLDSNSNQSYLDMIY